MRTKMSPLRLARLLAASLVASLAPLLVAFPTAQAQETKRPAVGDEARDFELAGLDGKSVKLSDFTKKGPVVLMVLRGFPGYQCPLCSRQVGQYLAAAKKLQAAGASVLMIYPGPADGLKSRAKEFIAGKTLPDGFHLLIDPDYTFTSAWHLRWDAPRETAYPSTFVVGKDNKILFAKISQTHGNRAAVEDVLKTLATKSSSNADRPEQGASSAAEIFERLRRHTFHPLHEGFTKDSKLDRHGIADLSNDDWRVRTLAIGDLAKIGWPAAPSLLAGLEDDDLHVRQISAFVLGILPTEDASTEKLAARLRGLEARLQSDVEPVVRSEAAIALGRIAAATSMDGLKKAVEQDASRDVRHQCALALDRMGKKQSDHSMFEAYRSLNESTFNTVSVGKPAVDFTLQDTEGDSWRLSDFRGKKYVVLIWIFADWCPVCHGEFRDLVQMKQDFIDSDVAVATIECHERYRSRVMVGKELLPQYWFAKKAPQAGYPGAVWWSHLSDPAGKVGAMYGVSPLAFAVHSECINRPSTIILDKQGIVRFTYYGTFWGDRPSIHQTLDMIRSSDFTFEHPKRLPE